MHSEIIVINRLDDCRDGNLSSTASLGIDDPFGNGRRIYWSGPDAVSVGMVRFADSVASRSFPHLEMLVVVDGRLTLSSDTAAPLELGPGAGAVIARGTTVQAHSEHGAQWAFCATTGAASADAGLQLLSADVPLAPSAAPAAEFLVGPAPQCGNSNAFTDEAARFYAGVWASTPYKRISRLHQVNELMHIIKGSVSLTGSDGVAVTVEAGGTVFVPRGAACAWDSSDDVAKFYAIQKGGV